MPGVLTFAVAAGGTGTAAAFELFGFKFFEGDDNGDDDVIGVPQRYDVEFVESGDRDVDGSLKGASSLWADRDEPAAGAAGLLAKARGDYRSLLATLYSQGRYGGAISITIDGREAADLPPDSEFGETASVRIAVTPGPLFTLREAEIVNQAPPPVERNDEVALPRDEGFASGEIARSGRILRAERLAVEALAPARLCQGGGCGTPGGGRPMMRMSWMPASISSPAAAPSMARPAFAAPSGWTRGSCAT